MGSSEDIRHVLSVLLSNQRLAVLSTHSNGQPYASLVAFACSDDLRYLYFVTPRKFGNLTNDCRMALLVTSSANQEVDFHEAMEATVEMRWEEIWDCATRIRGSDRGPAHGGRVSGHHHRWIR